VGIATSEAVDRKREQNPKKPPAISLGHLGGRDEEKARAKKLSPDRRSKIARKTAQARYGHRR
jgi:hypothetical protein